MEKELLVRRGMHCLIALAPVYFLLPEDLPFLGVPKWVGLIVFLAIVSVFEALRRMTGMTFLGLRPHEQTGVASFAWAAAGITFVLWLIPKDLATAALIGMAFVDPLAGELRSRYGEKPQMMGVSVLVYFMITFSALVLWGNHGVVGSGFIALVGAGVAIPAEAFKSKYIDDDFAMLVYPAIVMSWVAEAV